DDQIFAAIVVVVKKADAPAGAQQSHLRDAGAVSVVVEGAIAVVAIERILLHGEVRDDQVRKTVVVVVLEVDTHAGISLPFTVYRDLRGETDLAELVSVVPVEELEHGVVRDRQIYLAVTVEVRKSNPEPLRRLVEAEGNGLLCKCPVSVVAIHH